MIIDSHGHVTAPDSLYVYKANGSSCEQGTECRSTFCVEGICCNENACAGALTNAILGRLKSKKVGGARRVSESQLADWQSQFNGASAVYMARPSRVASSSGPRE